MSKSKRPVAHPLVIVLTGDGKGKTTSAFGQVLRAAGQGLRCVIVQFVKAPKTYGEVEAMASVPGVSVHTLGIGFLGPHGRKVPESEHRKAALDALAFCRRAVREEAVDLCVLDEVNFALSQNLITREEILDFLDNRPEGLTVVLTGRGAPDYLVDRADLVTECREIRHPYQKGIQAQKGIEY